MIGIRNMFIHDIKPLNDALQATLTRRTLIRVRDESEPWLIKVNQPKCRLCGHLLSQAEECDPWFEGATDD